jgi:N-carbamoyl-L-amino-acid hydrolase
MSGLLEDADLKAVDDEGVPIGDRLKDVGGDITRIQQAVRCPGDLCAYLELHIEQGPTLQQNQIPVGIVTAITGRVALEVSVVGVANHAGTTPMNGRRDALLASSSLIQAVSAIAAEEEICRVGTVGMVKVSPGAENVIPGRVDFSVEFRDVDMQRLIQAGHRFRGLCQSIMLTSDVEVYVNEVGVTQPQAMCPRLSQAIHGAAQKLSLLTASLPSGAGHDAQSMAKITDAAMIFVPSVDGVSHSPLEYSDPQACVNGANVLLHTLLTLDETLD